MSETVQSNKYFHNVLELEHEENNTSITQEISLISNYKDHCQCHPTSSTQTWEEAAKALVLPIRCRNTNGLLYKEKFGSGSKGECIKFDGDNIWCTPVKFEIICGRGNFKDWKRSIFFHGHGINLKTLILKKYLVLHATTCVCSICLGDPNSVNPILHFRPYHRKKKYQTINENMNGGKQMESSNIGTSSQILGMTSSSVNSSNQNVMKINHGVPSGTKDGWKIIEDAVDSLVKSSTILKSLVEEMRKKSNQEMDNLRFQLQNSTTQTTNVQLNSIPVPDYPKVFEIHDSNQIYTYLVESISSGSDNIIPFESNSHDVLTSSNCGNCGQYGGFNCSGCHVVNYCSTFCQNKDWPKHRVSCQVQVQPECKEESHVGM